MALTFSCVLHFLLLFSNTLTVENTIVSPLQCYYLSVPLAELGVPENVSSVFSTVG